jgi:hypothetical protein
VQQSHVTREKYTDSDLVAHEARNPVILNGIPDLVTYGDLADRFIQITLPVIDPDKRRTERDLMAEFRADLPKILGGIFNALSCAVKNIRDVRLQEKPRMAEATEFVTAAEPALGWESGTFCKHYLDYARGEQAASIEADPFAKAVVEYVKSKTEGCQDVCGHDHSIWVTADEVLTAVTTGKEWRDIEYFPRNGRTCGDHLRRIAPALRSAGLIADMPGRKPTRQAGKLGRFWHLGIRPAQSARA